MPEFASKIFEGARPFIVTSNRKASHFGTPLKFAAWVSPRWALLWAIAGLTAFLPVWTAAAQAVDTDPLNREPSVQAGFRDYYNMDYDRALARFQKIEAEHPSDPMATDYVLHVVVFQELWRLDLLDTTLYATNGFLTGKHTVVEDPNVRDRIKALAQKAVDQSNAELRKNPKDVNALFARGWAKSLESVYEAMVERSFGSALKLALQAKDDDQRVLQFDPRYVDAKMVVGIYQYAVGSLPFGFKLIFGFAGIHGSKATGEELLQDAAQHGVITSVESRTALAIFLRRDAKYQQAIAINKTLVADYPHDFLFSLERANLSKDAGQGMTAVNLYRQVISDARRPGYFTSAHLELAYYGLGASLRGQRMYQESVEAFEQGASQPTISPELKRRCMLAVGEDYDLMKQRNKARQEYQAVIDEGANSAQGELARKYLRASYADH